MSYMAKGPPTKDQPPNPGARPINQAPTPGSQTNPQMDANNAFQQQQTLLSTIQQQIYMQQATGQALAGWSSLTTQQQTVSNVPAPMQMQQMQQHHHQLHQNQYPAAVPPQQQQQHPQQQPNITISKVPAPPTSIHPTPTPVAAANQQSAQIPVTQPLASTTTAQVVGTQNNSGLQAVTAVQASPKPVVSQSSPPSVSNNVSSKPPALAPITQTPPKPQVSPVSKPAESPNKTQSGTTITPVVSKSVTPVKESGALPPRPISHQNTTSISIVQKTPTKSTLKLATVTPRIKTTPKKSPGTMPIPPPLQRSLVNPAPAAPAQVTTSPGTDRPNALIKSKVSPPKPAPVKVDQKSPAIKAPEVTKVPSVVNSSPVTNNLVSPVKENNAVVTKDNEKDVKSSVVKELVKEQEGKKEQSETPQVPPVVIKEPSAVVVPSKVESESVKPVKEISKPVVEKKEPAATKPEPTKKEKAASTPARSKPERKPVQTTPRQEPKPSTSQGPDGSTGRTRRARKEVQPFQSPIPEIENAKKASINQGASTSKEPADKLIIFYKNEFLAVRNADGGFYICQAMANVTKKGQRINIRWYNEEDPGSGIYIPDYFDKTEFECVLTTVELQKSGKSNFKIPEAELKRVQHILKNALDVEKGIVPKPEITEENPDGLDLSLYTSETQLERPVSDVVTPKSSKKTPAVNDNKKLTAKKSLKRSRDESGDDDDDDSDYIALAKTVKTSVSQPARERSQRGVTTTTVTPDTASKKRKAPEPPSKAPPAKKAAPEKTPARSVKGKAETPSTPVEKPVETPKPQKNDQKKAPEATTKASNNKKAPAKAPPAKTTTKKETPLAANTSTNTGRPTRASRK